MLFFGRALWVRIRQRDYAWLTSLTVIPAMFMVTLVWLLSTGTGENFFTSIAGDPNTGAGGWADRMMNDGSLVLLLLSIPALIVGMFIILALPILSTLYIVLLLGTPKGEEQQSHR